MEAKRNPREGAIAWFPVSGGTKTTRDFGMKKARNPVSDYRLISSRHRAEIVATLGSDGWRNPELWMVRIFAKDNVKSL